jgi:hypothetical protein
MDTLQSILHRWGILHTALDERQRRLYAAAEAQALGRGGVSTVAKATGLARATISAGAQEIQNRSLQKQALTRYADGVSAVRQPGGGRKPLASKDPTLLADLLDLLEPAVPRTPSVVLLWTCKSLRTLAVELQSQGHNVSHAALASILRNQGFAMRTAAKTLAGSAAKRQAQFVHIERCVRHALSTGQVCAVVEASQAVTTQMVVNALEHWWFYVGKLRHPGATTWVLVTPIGEDGGPPFANQWQVELTHLARVTGVCVQVHYLPPGTLKWLCVDQRQESVITTHWARGVTQVQTDKVSIALLGQNTAQQVADMAGSNANADSAWNCSVVP